VDKWTGSVKFIVGVGSRGGSLFGHTISRGGMQFDGGIGEVVSRGGMQFVGIGSTTFTFVGERTNCTST
jgi:hypothetical protein